MQNAAVESKKSMTMKRYLILAVLLLGGGFLLKASFFSGPMLRELERITSPNGRDDVVIAEVETGATVSTVYEVFVVDKGKAIKDGELVLRLDKGDKPQAIWQGGNSLKLKAPKARIWHFRNFVSYDIEIVLQN